MSLSSTPIISSTFGVFHVKDEGQRSAKITNIYADVTGIDQLEAMETLREYVAGGRRGR